MRKVYAWVSGLLMVVLAIDSETSLAPVDSAAVLFGFDPATSSVHQGTQEESRLLVPQVIGLLTLIQFQSLSALVQEQGLASRHICLCSWKQTC